MTVPAATDRERERHPVRRLRRVVTSLLVLVLATMAVPATPAAAGELDRFVAVSSDGSLLGYIDFTMINASSSSMVVLAHGADYPKRVLRGNELYDNSVLSPGDYAEYAASGVEGGVNYLWSMIGTKYQVKFRSERVDDPRGGLGSANLDESITCDWYENGDYSREITDAPYTCGVSVNQGQYGHTTEWMTVADKDTTVLDADRQRASLQMVDKLCADSNGGKVYPASCAISYDLKGGGSKIEEGTGLPTFVARGTNCLDDRDVQLSSTKAATVSNTVGWGDTTTVSFTMKWIWPKAYEFSITGSNSYTYSSSTTTSSTDTNVYSAPMKPKSGVTISVTYPVLRLTTGLKATIAGTNLNYQDITTTLRKPDSEGVEKVQQVTLAPGDCS